MKGNEYPRVKRMIPEYCKPLVLGGLDDLLKFVVIWFLELGLKKGGERRANRDTFFKTSHCVWCIGNIGDIWAAGST